MKTRALDRGGDWTFGAGLQNYLTGADAIAQDVQTALKSWTGNCFWSLQDFVNWTQFLDKNQEAQLLAALQNVILNRFGVVALNQLSAVLDRATRQIVVTYDVTTIYTQSFQNTIAIGVTNA
jgi:hypothetical protein